MSRERLFRRDDVGVFDWQALARALAVDGETASVCYEIALHAAGGDLERAESLYLRQLRALAETQNANSAAATPGRLSRAIYEASPGKYWTMEELARLPIGKFTRLQIETTHQDRFPGYDGWLAAMASLSAAVQTATQTATPGTAVDRTEQTSSDQAARTSEAASADDARAARDLAADAPARLEPRPLSSSSHVNPFERATAEREHIAASSTSKPAAAPDPGAPSSTAAALRRQLHAAAVAGRGVAQALTDADPATAREALQQLRADDMPMFRLVDQAAAGEVERVLGRRAAAKATSGDRSARPGHGDRQLPPDVLDRMEHAYGQRFEDVEIHLDSAEVPAGQEAVTHGRHIYFEPGAFAPGSEHGEQVIAHELAHVAQQSRSAGDAQPANRAALEADAHQAALSVIAGRAATVNLSASPRAVLGFSNGKLPPRSGASSAAARGAQPPAQRARGASPAAPRATAATGATAKSPGATSRSSARPARASATGAVPSAAPARKGAGGDGLLVPEAPSALTPGAAARLQTIHTGNQGVAAATTQLPTAQQQTDVARAAVVEPQAEQDAHAQHGVVTAVDDRPPPSPEIEQACARIRQVIRDKRPPDEDKLVEARPKEMAQEAGQQMSAGVEQRAGEVRQGYADIQQSPTGTPTTTPVPATLPPEKAQTPAVDAAAGTPDPLGHDDVSLDADVAAQQKKIDDAGMNTEPGKLVQDGPIGDAREGASDLQSMAKTDPQKVLADQAAAIGKAKGDMQALQAAGEKALADARAGAVSGMGKHTTGVKGSEEQQRAAAGEKMKGIFSRTQQTVDKLLQPLAGNAVARWDAGVAQLSTEFEASLADVKRRIDERHSGVGGALVGAWDWATGLPDWVTQGYDRAEAKFADGATNLIRDISRDVNAVIDDCKKLIQQARKDIDDVVKSLPASLQAWAQGEAAKLNQQLDALDKRVDQTQQGINKDLVNRANGAVQQVRERVAQLREEAKGALAKIAAAIGEFLKNPFKAIVDGLLRILGIPPEQFWSLVGRLGDVVGAIAKDPVKFGKTLISGAGQGFQQFFDHFPQHLKEILMGWLFGQLGTAGVPMPTDFSAAGILPTVLAIVGIDGGLVNSMLGGALGDPDEMAEAHQEIAGVLSGDPKALAALLHDHFDAASLIPMIREAAMNFLIQALIKQVAVRIAALLVPGGAILQAVEAIFKVLLWVVTNAARIFTLIESLVGAAAQAVAGNTAGVANAVENSLVQAIVLVIDFLASFLGLGGLGAKLKGVVMKVAGKLKGILKKVIDAITKRAKAKAKAKRDAKKPAHDPAKPDAAHPPKPDERDPQKRKDDAKDPRNHMRDPDDKDPRNHNKDDDDRDPRNHHKDDDDRDPRNHKRKDHDRPDGTKRRHPDDHEPKKHMGDDDDAKKRKNDDKDKARLDDGQVGDTQTFMSGDEHHRLWAAKKGTSYVLMVASTPEELQSLLNSRRIRQLSAREPELQSAVATAKQILALADIAIDQIMTATRTNNDAALERSDKVLENRMRELIPALRDIMFRVATSRKPASIHKLFQENNHAVAPGTTDASYGESLKSKLEEFSLAIAAHRAGTGSGKEAIDAIRGKDKVWTVHQGAIYAPFVAEQEAATDDLSKEAQGCDLVMSLERGGTLVQDEIVSGSDTRTISIPKRETPGEHMTPREITAAVEMGHITPEDARKLAADPRRSYRLAQKSDLRSRIDKIMHDNPDRALKIVLTETRVSGSSVNFLIGIVNDIIRTGHYPNLRFKILALDQTMHSPNADASRLAYAPVANADRVEVVLRSTSYILGEDVAFQVTRGAKHPIIVFKGTEHQLVAYRITPQDETISRDIIIDLVDGAYNSFLPGVL